ncbi:hypothetical protein ABVF33_00650 [Candidatus Rickettsia barbariae]
MHKWKENSLGFANIRIYAGGKVKGALFVTCHLETLATLDPKPNSIEHEYYSEIIGNL